MVPAPASDPSSQVDTPMTDANDEHVSLLTVDGAADAPMTVSDALILLPRCAAIAMSVFVCSAVYVKLSRNLC